MKMWQSRLRKHLARLTNKTKNKKAAKYRKEKRENVQNRLHGTGARWNRKIARY